MQGNQVEGIIKGKDGTLRWVYELNMWRTPVLLITIGKVLLLACLFPALLIFFLSLFEGDGLAHAFLFMLKVGAICLAIIGGLLLFAYPLVALINGGRYSVVFEMTERGINHIQIQKQFEKNQVLGMVAAAAGLLSGNLQAAGAGLLAASRSSLFSSFAGISRILVDSRRQVIHLKEGLTRNQVYAPAADFAFVRDYIIERCPQARVIIR